MSGTASVGNTFQSAVTATGLQLDQNYSTIVAYLNDPTNRNNYAADSGTTNTIALAFSPPVVGGYTAGLQITFKVAAGNTGGVVLNANGLGNKNLFNAAGMALTGGEITAGQVVSAAYDGTQFQMLSGVANLVGAASQGQMVTAAATNVFVTPGRQQFHPSAAKAAATWNGTNTGTITAAYSFNVTNVVRVGLGTYQVNLATAFTSTVYIAQVTLGAPTTGGLAIAVMGQKTATSCVFTTMARDVSSLIDVSDINFTAYGTQ